MTAISVYAMPLACSPIFLQCVRRTWSERSYANDGTLDTAKEAIEVNQTALIDAEAKYDQVEV